MRPTCIGTFYFSCLAVDGELSDLCCEVSYPRLQSVVSAVFTVYVLTEIYIFTKDEGSEPHTTHQSETASMPL